MYRETRGSKRHSQPEVGNEEKIEVLCQHETKNSPPLEGQVLRLRINRGGYEAHYKTYAPRNRGPNQGLKHRFKNNGKPPHRQQKTD